MSETEAEYQARLTAWKRSYGKGPRPVRQPPGMLDRLKEFLNPLKSSAAQSGADWTKRKNQEYMKARKDKIDKEVDG